MKKVIKLFVCFCLFAMVLTFHDAGAKATYKKLFSYREYDFGVSYTSYDITGDGKKDNIQFDTWFDESNWSYRYLDVYVNEYTALAQYYDDGHVGAIDAYYICLKNNKKYLLINAYDTDYDRMVTTGLYRWSKSHLVLVKNLKTAISWNDFKLVDLVDLTVKNNTITVRYGTWSNTIGTGLVKIGFTYSKFKSPASTLTYSLFYNDINKNYLTSLETNKIKVYKTAGKTKVLTYITKGSKFYPKGVKKVGSKVYYRVKVGKKTGYIKQGSYNFGHINYGV